MSDYPDAITLGAAVITRINVGDLRYGTGEDGHPAHIPVLCILIQLPGVNVLVDAGRHDLPPDSPFAIPGYQPPPDLIDQLAGLGVQADQIAHVIITHAHFDHFNGVTRMRSGRYEPGFPNARYYLGQADWTDLQPELQQPNSLASRTLGVLQREGLLELVSAPRTLNEALQIIPAPGESPGHQIVRVQSEGQTLYCLGDIYHDTSEVKHPERMADWADRDQMQASRRALIAAALAENALLMATHIRTIGRFERTETGLVWRAAFD